MDTAYGNPNPKMKWKKVILS